MSTSGLGIESIFSMHVNTQMNTVCPTNILLCSFSPKVWDITRQLVKETKKPMLCYVSPKMQSFAAGLFCPKFLKPLKN